MNRPHKLLLVAFTIFLVQATHLPADTFTFVNDAGETVEVEARLTGSGEGMHALELADGSVRLVPQEAVKKRVPGDDPEPVGIEEMSAKLKERFGEELFRELREEPYLVCLILSSPLPRSSESRARAFLKKAGRFMKSVESNFTTFVKKMDIPAEEPRYPMAVLIFEADGDFEEYAEEITRSKGLSAGNISGFYSLETNYLVLRMSECRSFAVPLHEAIHQQVYNRRIFRRFAPIPVWFNEGIATGFEGDGERIRVGPAKINSTYAQLARRYANLDWSAIIQGDGVFGGDILAGAAYTHAWGLHWLLVTRHEEEYTEYVKLLAAKKPLETADPEEREEEFESVFGESVEDLQEIFPQILAAGIRQQKVRFPRREPAGLSVSHTGLAEVKVSAVNVVNLRRLMVKGTARNISPIRDMAYHITVETNSGLYAEWYIPNAARNRMIPLKRQPVLKLMPGAPGGQPTSFRVRVRAAATNSEEAQRWSRGQLPVPEYGR